MKSTGYFVGLLLAVMGAIITFAAVRSLVHPPGDPKILSYLHPDFWWGMFMLVFGLTFALFNRRDVVRGCLL